MKHKTLITALTAFGLWAFAINLHAQQVVLTLAINVTVTQLSSSNDDGTVTTYATTHESRHTSDLLKILALDEFAANNYPDTNFPAGAKLVVSNGVFQVVDKTNGLLADVSSIMSFGGSPEEVKSGKQNDSNGLASPSITGLQIGGINFDDTAIHDGQKLQFNLQGLVKQTQMDVVNTKAGTYAETFSAQLSSGVGEGTSGGDPFVLTGTLTAAGKGTLTLPIIATHLGK